MSQNQDRVIRFLVCHFCGTLFYCKEANFMFFPKIEYSLTTKPLDELTALQVKTFLGSGEKIIQIFDGEDIIAVFADKKIIFVSIPANPMSPNIQYEVKVLPYRNICRYSVLRLSNTQHGKLELTFPGGVLSFYIPEYHDALELIRKIEQYILQ